MRHPKRGNARLRRAMELLRRTGTHVRKWTPALRRTTPCCAASGERTQLRLANRSLPINNIGAFFERRGKALEGGVEHGAHQERQHPAFEFIGEEKADVAVGFRFGFEGPAVLEIAERPLQI